MDTSRQVPDGSTAKSEPAAAAQRQRRSLAEKRRMVEETLVEGASVARIARAHGVNREPAVWLAPALLERKTRRAEANDEVSSCAGE
jgi:transposase-like protein